MVESDHSDRESSQDEVSSLEDSNQSVENNAPAKKRLREDVSEVENVQIHSKKRCTSADDIKTKKDETECTSKVNGNVEEAKENVKDVNDSDVTKASKDTFLSGESTGEDTKEICNIKNKSEDKKEAFVLKEDNVATKEKKAKNSIDNECKDGASSESETNMHDSDTEKEEIEEKESKGDIKSVNDFDVTEFSKDKSLSEEGTDEGTKEACNIKSETADKEDASALNEDHGDTKEKRAKNSTNNEYKGGTPLVSKKNIHDTERDKGARGEKEATNTKQKKGRKSHIEDSEVVEGLELSVECASEKESSSSSESEDEKEKKPKPKTIIVKEKPNDSELDASSSEAERSDLQDASEVKSTPKPGAKKGRKKGRTSFSKAKGTDSEDNNDNVSDDEDYSPRTKKRLMKAAANKKVTKSSSEPKQKRGKEKKTTQKAGDQEDKEEEALGTEDSNTVADKESEENSSESASLRSDSENESDSESVKKDGKGRKSGKKPDDDKRIQFLKKYIRVARIHVKSYSELWVGCKSNAAKVRCLKELLEKNGITGRPTFEKCKKAKQRLETLKDIAELNTSNILSEGRMTRAQRNKDSGKDMKTPETPTKYREARSSFKRVLRVVDSDSE